MDAVLRRFVRDRAVNHCEYCRLPQSEHAYTFHIEHIQPKQHGGRDDEANLCLACPSCNLGKGTNLVGIDPDSGMVVRLFHPRQDPWSMHFKIAEGRILGLTEVGRTTAWLMKMNTAPRVGQRLRLGMDG